MVGESSLSTTESKSSEGGYLEGTSRLVVTTSWRLKVMRYVRWLSGSAVPWEIPVSGRFRATVRVWPKRHNQEVRHCSVRRLEPQSLALLTDPLLWLTDVASDDTASGCWVNWKEMRGHRYHCQQRQILSGYMTKSPYLPVCGRTAMQPEWKKQWFRSERAAA
jgi:hypothetical protein